METVSDFEREVRRRGFSLSYANKDCQLFLLDHFPSLAAELELGRADTRRLEQSLSTRAFLADLLGDRYKFIAAGTRSMYEAEGRRRLRTPKPSAS